MGFDVPKYERVVDGLNGVRDYINFWTKIDQDYHLKLMEL